VSEELERAEQEWARIVVRGDVEAGRRELLDSARLPESAPRGQTQ
jgi:hypothetical protein